MGQTNHGWFTVGPDDKQQSYLFKSVGGEFHSFQMNKEMLAKQSHQICWSAISRKKQVDIPIHYSRSKLQNKKA